jgi:uncharacterized protein YndB with AHSA1/START domain
MNLRFQVYTKIQRPIRQVFDAVYNPKKLTKYFTTRSASAPMQAGTTVWWSFADFPGSFPVHVKRTIPNKRIVFEWKAQDGNYDTRVQMDFKSLGPRESKVLVTESGWRKTPKGLASSYGNCMGWMHMITCLKAYLEYGITLRKGAF